MEDVLTEIPPPSRFFQEELNNFATPPPPLPSPFLLLSDLKSNKPLHPSLVIVALSSPSLYFFHRLSSKTLIGSVILPEIPFSGNYVRPSFGDNSCNIYTLDNANESVLLICVQCSVTDERSHSVAKLLMGDRIAPERVLLLDSVQRQNFRGKLSPDEAYAFKLETSSEREALKNASSSALSGLEYYPSGSVVDGFAASLLSRCQMKNIRATLCLAWPEHNHSVGPLLKSVLSKNMLSHLDFTSTGNNDDEYLLKKMSDSDLYIL